MLDLTATARGHSRGGGIPLSGRQASPLRLRLLGADRIFPDGTAELIYAPQLSAGTAAY